MIEVNVNAGDGICKQKPACLGKAETVRIRIQQNCAYRQRCLGEHLYGVERQLGLIGYLLLGKTIYVITQKVQYSELYHQA